MGATPALTPQLDGLGAQVIDVEDLADLVVRIGGDRWVGTMNAVGDHRELGALIALARETAGHTAPTVASPDDWLQSHGVTFWAGPRSLPLWLPRDMPGFSSRTNDVCRTAGGRLRGIHDTLARTLDDERERGLDRACRSGLSRAEERELLEALAPQ